MYDNLTNESYLKNSTASESTKTSPNKANNLTRTHEAKSEQSPQNNMKLLVSPGNSTSTGMKSLMRLRGANKTNIDSTNTSCQVNQTSDSTYIEGPSPERLSTRIQPATVTTLREIHDNFVPRAYYQSNFYPDYGIGSTASYSNAGIRYYETTGPPESINSSARFLELPAPYHYLPDTPYFRRAPIIPPPVNNSQGVVPLQRIINRYVTSMKEHDKLLERPDFLATPRKSSRTRERLERKQSPKNILSISIPDDKRKWTPWTQDFVKI